MKFTKVQRSTSAFVILLQAKVIENKECNFTLLINFIQFLSFFYNKLE